MNRKWMHTLSRAVRLLLWSILLIGSPAIGSQPTGEYFRIEFQYGEVLLRSDGATLEAVLAGIYEEFGITVSGLAALRHQPVSAALRGGTIEEVMQRLFKHLGERNYAFEYVKDRLSRVSVFPESRATAPPPVEPESSIDQDAVEVIDTVEGTQARTIGLQKGDLIVEYDGIPLTRASELVKETKKHTPFEAVEMTIMRDGEPMRMFINGGLIGVRVKTVKIPDASP